MNNILDFFTKRVNISDTITVQLWVFFTIALAVVVVAVILAFVIKGIRKAKDEETEPLVEEPKPLTPEEASKEYFDVINSKIDIPAPSKPIIIEEVTAEEEKSAPAPAPQPKPSEKVEVKQVKEEVAATADDIPYIKEETIEKQIAGKFAIVNSSVGGFRYALIANNVQLLYESRDYKSKNTCIEGVAKFCSAVLDSTFTVKKDKFDRYKFVLRPKNNPNAIFVGESFKDRTACLSNIESVKRFVFANSPIVDRTKDDYVAESECYEVPPEIKKAAREKLGMPGKWEIAEIEDDGEKFYEYLLFANNGQLLYESKEYKSYSTCKSGLMTFIDTVKNGYFIIDSDKAGRYKFVLRSNKPGSQAEYIGQFYRSLDACQSSINSVYKFALISSVDAL